MNTDLLLKEFREILAHEERAKNFYEHYIEQVDDEDIRAKLIEIRDDEKVHIKIAERLVELVS